MPKYTPKQVIERVNKLKGDRGTIENHWQEIADFIFPRKNDFITEFTPGEKRNAQVVDNTGMVALELLAGALHGMLTSPNSLWFGLSTGDQKLDSRDDVRMWLQDTAIEIHNTLNNSNFQTEIHEVYLDEIAFGTSVMSIEEDEKSVVRFATRHLKECYICENSKGRVDEVYRCFKWTAKDIVNEFGEGKDKVGEKVMKAYESGKDDQKFEIIHYVYPADYKGGQTFKYESQYILAADKMLLKSGGFNELPYVAPRWSKAAGEVYGRSPGMNALPEVKTVNVMAETIIKGAQKVVDPPLQAPDEGVIRPIKTKPGSFNYYRAGTTDRIEPIFNDSRIDFGFEVMKERHERIREAFFVNQLQLAQGPQMTATEVLQRSEENLRFMGPVMGRQNEELLSPMIDRVFNIMLRRGKIPPMPLVLSERKISVQYSSMIAKTQRLSEVNNINRMIQVLSPFVTVDPSITDNIDGDQVFLYFTKMFDFPQVAIRTRKDVKEMRDARDQANQARLQAEAAARQADIISKVGPGIAAVQNTGQGAA